MTDDWTREYKGKKIPKDHILIGQGWKLLGLNDELHWGDQTTCLSTLLSLDPVIHEPWKTINGRDPKHIKEWGPLIGMKVRDVLRDDMDQLERLFRRIDPTWPHLARFEAGKQAVEHPVRFNLSTGQIEKVEGEVDFAFVVRHRGLLIHVECSSVWGARWKMDEVREDPYDVRGVGEEVGGTD